MKKFLQVMCVLFMTIFICTGCASANYMVLINTDGSVEQVFEVELNKEIIENANYNFSEVRQKIKNSFVSIVNNQISNIQIYCLRKSINYLTCGITCEYKDINETTLYAGMKFENIKLFQDYKNTIKTLSGDSGEETEDNKQTIDYVFLEKNMEYSKTVYYQIYNDDFVKDILEYFNGTNGNEFTLSDVEYNFYYGLPSSSLYSENSEVYTKDGVVIHHWNFSADTMDNDIITYTITIKPVMWYVVALSLSAILVGALFFVVLIQKKLKKSKKLIVNEDNK